MDESKKSILKNPQNVIAIGVTIISLCALIVSVQQTRIMREEGELMREYSRTSVWPRIEMRTHKAHNPQDKSIEKLTMSLTNSGIGPAIITDVKISYKGKIVNDWWELFKYQEIPDSIETTLNNASFNNRIIKIGEVVEILNFNDNPSLAGEFYKRVEGLEIELYYESIYHEQWKYDGENTVKLEHFKGLSEEEQFY